MSNVLKNGCVYQVKKVKKGLRIRAISRDKVMVTGTSPVSSQNVNHFRAAEAYYVKERRERQADVILRTLDLDVCMKKGHQGF